MVNQTLVDYLKQYSSQYSLEDLKQKVLGSGYSEQDFNEASTLLELGGQAKPQEQTQQPKQQTQPVTQQPTQTQEQQHGQQHLQAKPLVQQPGQQTQQVQTQGQQVQTQGQQPVTPISQLESGGKGGFKWMKLAGISGFIIAGFFLLSLIISFTSIVSFILMLFFYYGFARMGKHVQSRALRFGAISLIVLLIVIAVSAILLAVIFPAIMMSASPDNIRESQSDFGITGAAISDGGLSGILILVLILGGLLGLFAIVARVLFVVGLFVAGKDVRFATLAGVFDILSILVIIGSSAYFFMQSVSNPFLLIDSIRITQIISVIANTIYMIFASFALLSASKKFE